MGEKNKKPISAQELYDHLYVEMYDRAEAKGQKPPKEDKVYAFFVQQAREAIIRGEAPPDFMEEVDEVVPMITRQRLEELQNLERELRLRIESNKLSLAITGAKKVK